MSGPTFHVVTLQGQDAYLLLLGVLRSEGFTFERANGVARMMIDAAGGAAFDITYDAAKLDRYLLAEGN
jgi:hypothetical protein